MLMDAEEGQLLPPAKKLRMATDTGTLAEEGVLTDYIPPPMNLDLENIATLTEHNLVRKRELIRYCVWSIISFAALSLCQ